MMGRPPSGGAAGNLTELSVVAKCDNDSSGVGSSTSGGAGTNSSASPTGSSSVPQNEDYEHVYCQLDPYFVSIFTKLYIPSACPSFF